MLPWKLDSIVTPLQPFRYQDNLIEKRRCLLLCEEQSGNLIQPLSAQLYTNLWHNNEQTKTPRLVLTTKVIRACFSKLQLLTTFAAITRTLRICQKESGETPPPHSNWTFVTMKLVSVCHQTFYFIAFQCNNTSEIFTALKYVCRKVMFSQATVCSCEWGAKHQMNQMHHGIGHMPPPPPHHRKGQKVR